MGICDTPSRPMMQKSTSWPRWTWDGCFLAGDLSNGRVSGQALDHRVSMVGSEILQENGPDKYETKVVVCWDTTDILPTSTDDFFQQYFIALILFSPCSVRKNLPFFMKIFYFHWPMCYEIPSNKSFKNWKHTFGTLLEHSNLGAGKSMNGSVFPVLANSLTPRKPTWQ